MGPKTKEVSPNEAVIPLATGGIVKESTMGVRLTEPCCTLAIPLDSGALRKLMVDKDDPVSVTISVTVDSHEIARRLADMMARELKPSPRLTF